MGKVFPRFTARACIVIGAVGVVGSCAKSPSPSSPAAPGASPTNAGPSLTFSGPYTVAALGAFTCAAINGNGAIAGFSPNGHAFVRAPDGTMTDLGIANAADATAAVAMNTAGSVVGASTTRDPNGLALSAVAVAFRGGVWTPLGFLGTGDGRSSTATDINDANQIVGYSTFATTPDAGGPPDTHAFLSDASGVMKELPTLGSGSTQAHGVNASGVVVGSADIDATSDNARTHACRWRGAAIDDLGTLGGTSSLAADINDSGAIVGMSQTAGSAQTIHAFLYVDSAMRDLGTLSGDVESRAIAINAGGTVVGVSRSADRTQRAFVSLDGALLDLTPSDPSALRSTNGGAFLQTEVNAIADNGQIVGGGTAPNGAHYCLLWTPK